MADAHAPTHAAAHIAFFAEVFSEIWLTALWTVTASELLSPTPRLQRIVAHGVDYMLLRWTVVTLWARYSRCILAYLDPPPLRTWRDIHAVIPLRFHEPGLRLQRGRATYRVVWPVPALALCAWAARSGMAARMTRLMGVWFTLDGGDLAALPELLIVVAVLVAMTLFPRMQARSNLAPVAIVIALFVSLAPLIPASLFKPAHITAACNKTWAVLVYLTARYDPFPDRIAADRVLVTLLPLITLFFFGTLDDRRMHRIEI